MGNLQIAYCLTLTLFESGILFVDDIQFPFAAYDLTICASFLNGCSYFHFLKLCTSSLQLVAYSYQLIYT